MLEDYCYERDKKRIEAMNSGDHTQSCWDFNEWVIKKQNEITTKFDYDIHGPHKFKRPYHIDSGCTLRNLPTLFKFIECKKEKDKEKDQEKESDEPKSKDDNGSTGEDPKVVDDNGEDKREDEKNPETPNNAIIEWGGGFTEEDYYSNFSSKLNFKFFDKEFQHPISIFPKLSFGMNAKYIYNYYYYRFFILYIIILRKRKKKLF